MKPGKQFCVNDSLPRHITVPHDIALIQRLNTNEIDIGYARVWEIAPSKLRTLEATVFRLI